MSLFRRFAFSSDFSPIISTISILWLFAFVSQVSAFHIDLSKIRPQNSNATVTVIVTGDRCYCHEAKWYNILTFFTLNYAAHALTVRMRPGQSIAQSIVVSIFAICFPYGKIIEELMIMTVCLRKVWKETSLKTALRARALCHVTKCKPKSLHMLISTYTQEHKKDPSVVQIWAAKLLRKRVFGQRHYLPEGYRFQTLGPEYTNKVKLRRLPGAKLEEKPKSATCGILKESSPDLELPKSSTILKAAVSIGQACYAIFTLVVASARCGKLETFGWASPAFTVLPYATMSLINALSVVITPNYPIQFVVYTDTVDEAIKDGWQFESSATVGYLERCLSESCASDSTPQQPNRSNKDESDNVGERHMSPDSDELTIQYRHVSNKLATDTMPGLLSQGGIGTVKYDEKTGNIRQNIKDETPRDTSQSQKRKDADGHRRCCNHIICLKYFIPVIALVCVAVPYIVIKGLTNFEPGQSSLLQRGIIMSWLLLGPVARFVTLLDNIYDYSQIHRGEKGLKQFMARLITLPLVGLVKLVKRSNHCWRPHKEGQTPHKEEQTTHEEDQTSSSKSELDLRENKRVQLGLTILFFLIANPALPLYSFVIVGKMIRDMGECIPLN